MKNILLLSILFLFAQSSQANVLFEGWFEIYLGAKKIGYTVERYEFENNKFKAVTYVKTNTDGKTLTESLKAFSANDLKPLNYSYTSKNGADIKIIDATFTGDKMNLKINDGKGEKKQTKVFKKGTFLSTFLLYMIMSQKDGLTEDKSYNYSAIAEEDGTAYSGTAKIAKLEKVKGKEAFKVLNKFKGDSFFSWVTAKGEFLLTRMPDTNLEIRFAENQAEATKDFSVNLADLKLLFGKIPGDSGVKSATPETTTSETMTNPKTEDAKPTKKPEAKTPSKTNVQPDVPVQGLPPKTN